jgi:outer membrane lipoprotein-sorting protein
MEKAYNNIKAYHGVMEVVQMNEFKEESLQAKREVWADKNGNYYVKELEGTNAGLITVNNGTKKWQLDEERKQVSLYSVFPDSYRFTLELGNEIEDIKSAVDIKIIGEDTIAGRAALKLMITPAGGSSYFLWTDKETNLPLQKETPMQNSIGYRITYTDIDFMDAIPEEQMNYYAPSDYEVVNTNDEQIVNNLEEVQALIGFNPAIISQIPEDYQLDTISISNGNSNANFYYTNGKNTIIFSQEKAKNKLKTDPLAILGEVNGNPAEIITSAEHSEGILNGGGVYAGLNRISSIRWQEKGFEYLLLGDMTFKQLTKFAEAVSGGKVVIPEQAPSNAKKPQIETTVDMEAEENEQKSVDAGHSPWKLDPAFVTQVYVSLLISPEGIVGDYPIAYEDVIITENTGSDAVAEIHNDKSPAAKVYLKRLIRQDSTGIWTVVGYDPVK